ncbi:MAG TPA: ATP-binding cassette domain-containing protein [Chloroflexota bacterium]|nr:ATP-binding cassette domain-containing protein [Chloroflexota bacterium]
MPPAIEADDLEKRFSAKQTAPGLLGSLRAAVRPTYRETVAVAGCTFAVDAGEPVAFIGPNGAGKSTTIKMLTGILYPSGGSARVLGLVPWAERRTLAYNIAAVFGQKSQLWYHLPPLATFDLLARIYELEQREYRRRAAELIELFELGPHLHTAVRRLSLGERMRCELAAALLHRPKVIFLDEPTIGLDVIAKQRIRALIRRLNTEEGTTVFLTSHDADDVEQICKRVIVINHGTLILDEPISTLKSDYLQKKVVDLRRHDRNGGWELEQLLGVETLEQSEWGLKLEVDTAAQPIERVISHLVGRHRVADITISDPPMEEIIAQIYQRRPEAVAAGAVATQVGVPRGDD